MICPQCGLPACTCSTISRPVVYHPTLEGHPAWEAFKHAPVDQSPVTDDERAAVDEARKGSFTRIPPMRMSLFEASAAIRWMDLGARRAMVGLDCSGLTNGALSFLATGRAREGATMLLRQAARMVRKKRDGADPQKVDMVVRHMLAVRAVLLATLTRFA